MNSTNEISAVQLKHTFAVTGFLVTAIAIIALTIFYREMVINDIVLQGERENQILAQTALNSVKDELISYLDAVNHLPREKAKEFDLPPNLMHAIQKTLSNIYVTHIRIYSMDGRVIYSTIVDKEVEKDKMAFVSAIAGDVNSRLVYRDIFSVFQDETDEDNHIESYIPVQEKKNSPILGVFEISTDVDRIVKEIQHTEIMIVLGVIIILFLLYGMLVFIVRRAANTIQHQQSVIRERTRTLEILSSQLINSQEVEKKEIAYDLHENIAQTLAGIKNVIESAMSKQNAQKSNPDSGLQQSIILLRNSIDEIRKLAMELRPPSLDDFGLIKTLGWLCNQYQLMYPQIRIETIFELDDSSLSEAQRTIIYRVVQDALESVVQQAGADLVVIRLNKTGAEINLVVEDDTVLPDNLEENPSQTITSTIPLYAMRKRTVLSGGNFSIRGRVHKRGTIASASWLAA